MADTKQRLLPPRDVELRLVTERTQAEAISRRDESVASFYARKAQKNPNNDKMKQLADEAAQRSNESARHLDDLSGIVLPRDPEGTRADFADRFGNVAPNAMVANAGGTGIDGSNTAGDSGKQAQTPEEAMQGSVRMVGTVAVGRGGRPLVSEQGAARPGDAAPSFEQMGEMSLEDQMAGGGLHESEEGLDTTDVGDGAEPRTEDGDNPSGGEETAADVQNTGGSRRRRNS